MLRSLGFIVLLLATIALHAAVPPSLSGSWYNPAQAGHGISIQVLGDGRAMAYWFTYDRDGAPLHLYVDGRIDDRTIRGPAYSARGMRFGTFDPSALGLRRWGAIEIEFATSAGCSNATLRYDGNGEAGAGFGAGEMPLVRLSRIAGTACFDSDLYPQEIALYSGTYQRLPTQSPVAAGTPLEAAVDTDGLLWAYSTDQPPGPTWVGSLVPPVVVPSRSSIGGAGAKSFGRVLPNFAFYPWHVPSNGDDVGLVDTISVTRGLIGGRSTGGAYRRLSELRLSDDRVATRRVLAGRLDPASLAGATFHAEVRGQFIVVAIEAGFSADGRVCFRYPAGFATGVCYLEGRIDVRSTTHRFFDFELRETANGRVYRGRGWAHAEDPAVPTRVVFVGSSDDGIGLGLGMTRR